MKALKGGRLEKALICLFLGSHSLCDFQSERTAIAFYITLINSPHLLVNQHGRKNQPRDFNGQAFTRMAGRRIQIDGNLR